MGIAPGTRRGNRHRVAVVCGVALIAVLILGLILPSRAHASSGPGLSFTPTSGSIGTTVTVIINPASDSVGQSYTLDAGMGSSAMDACNGFNLQPIPGVTPFVLSQNGTSISFAWPSSLDQGPYWICAEPSSNTAGGGTAYNSTQPFTVTNAAATPAQTSGTTASSVVATVPAGGIVPGATFTVAVTGWSSPAGTPPQIVTLTVVSPSQATPEPAGTAPLGTSAQFTTAPGPNTGDYVLTVTAPTGLVSGTYWAIVADQQGQVYSNSFSVTVPATATTSPRPVSSPPSTNKTNSADTSPSLLVVGILLAVILVMLVVFFLRRRARLMLNRVQQPQERQGREQHDLHPQRQGQLSSTQWPADQWSQEQPRQEQWSPQALPRDPRNPRQ